MNLNKLGQIWRSFEDHWNKCIAKQFNLNLNYSNDILLSDMWQKIKLIINTSSRLNEYVYNNVVWNQIDVVDSLIL